MCIVKEKQLATLESRLKRQQAAAQATVPGPTTPAAPSVAGPPLAKEGKLTRLYNALRGREKTISWREHKREIIAEDTALTKGGSK